MKTININSLGWKYHVVLPSVLAICQSLAVKNSTVQLGKKKWAAFCRNFLTGAPTWERRDCSSLSESRTQEETALPLNVNTCFRALSTMVLVLTGDFRRVKREATVQVNQLLWGRKKKGRAQSTKKEEVTEQGTSKVWSQSSQELDT